MTDTFRALCAELIQQLQELHTMVWGEAPYLLDEDRGGSADLDLDIEDVLEKARAALAQPEPVAPTDYELAQLFSDSNRQAIKGACSTPEQAAALIRSHMEYARAVLARWGTPANNTKEEN